MRTATVKLARPGDVVAHAGRDLLVCRALVREPDGDTAVALYMLANGLAGALTLEALAGLTAHEPLGTRVAFVRDDVDGPVTVEAEPAAAVGAFPVAAAAAVMRASWAWDESQELLVVVNGVQITIAPRFNGEVWEAFEGASETV